MTSLARTLVGDIRGDTLQRATIVTIENRYGDFYMGNKKQAGLLYGE